MPPVWIVLMLLPIIGGAERFNCRGRILGAYYADAKTNCKAFHVCVRVAGGGIRDFRFFCPPGTLFHQEAQTCTDWGDDDSLECPNLYDGQFDIYKIGSGYDTKKLSSPGNREEEAEFGLQRAETGDRRLTQNNAASNNGPASDLRAAHSSDFFSGQRERGRDESAPPARPVSPSQPRQSFRRPTTPRAPPTTTQYTTPPPPPPPQPSNPPQYEVVPKRKLVRKRPLYVSTVAPSSFSQQPQQQNTQNIQNPQNVPQQTFSQQPQQVYQRIPQNRQTPAPPANVPPQYKDEYVEVSRVTPKQTPNRYYPNNPSPTSFSKSTSLPQFSKKEGLSELYNYEAQSTPGLQTQSDNRPFKVRNSFSVSDVSGEPDFARLNYNSNSGRGTPTTEEYNTVTSRGFATSTPAYKNFNSVSYEPEKNNFVSFSGTKQNYYNSPTTSVPTTNYYTTTRSDPALNLNTVAYNTNFALNTIQPSNFAQNNDDDGQYRLPAGEDDGQYRPEAYERELLSGAHSLNIAASGNRLPDDQKSHAKPKQKPGAQSAPRPFRPAPTPTIPPTQTTRIPEPTYTTTYRAPTTFNTQRTFDYFQTYTTTSRPSELPVSVQTYTFAPVDNAPVRSTTTTPAPRSPEPRPQPRAPAPPTSAPVPRAPAPPTSAPSPRPSPRAPNFTNPPSKKEDASYDYAYYDSDPGFSEYDHIEEFGRTKAKV